MRQIPNLVIPVSLSVRENTKLAVSLAAGLLLQVRVEPEVEVWWSRRWRWRCGGGGEGGGGVVEVE